MVQTIKITILSLIGMVVLSAGNAQPLFYSQSLKKIYSTLPQECSITDVATMVDTVILCNNIVQNDTVPIIYRWDENHVLEHIGYNLLPINNITTLDNAIIRFIERELLILLMTTDIDQTLISMRENGLSLLLNNTLIERDMLLNKHGILNLLKNNLEVAINYSEMKYDVTLICNDKQTLSFLFKADSELIMGMDKEERDVRLAIQLKNHHSDAADRVTLPDFSYLQPHRDTIYVDRGNSFLIPQINNDLFYVKADSTYHLALDKSLIAESFANALLVSVGNNYTMNITHRMYGNVVKQYTVSSRDFDDYFSHDYERYFGIESLEEENMTGTLILSDRDAGSIHLAFVSISLDSLLSGGNIDIQMHSNIPQHNIKSLFDK
jgi:hypothetical protein